MTDFHELYTRYAGEVYRFALYLSADKDEANDITAETFARALTGKSPMVWATAKGYLLTIARNLYLESLRRRRRITGLPPDLSDSRPAVDELVDRRNELEALQACLQTFPETDRTALLLRTEGVTYDEIAISLNISVASAKVKVHRLRLKLAEWRIKRETNRA